MRHPQKVNEKLNKGAVPRDAATVMIIRDASQPQTGIEVLMVRRHTKSNFAPGAYVFPGGAVETEDYAPQIAEICSSLTLQQAQNIIKDAASPERALGFFVAAIRETFEEVRILFAYQESGNLITFNEEEEARFAEYRNHMRGNLISFGEMIRRERLALAADRLFYFAHWITPEISPLRFDTRFFVAPAPSNQKPVHDMLETTANIWITPREALERYDRKEFLLLPPTISNLKSLAEFYSVDQVILSTRAKEVPTIMPKVTVEAGQRRVHMPGNLYH
jgi:8-oxo-dGTP pyrophosphatase MutT (NUDIX family)